VKFHPPMAVGVPDISPVEEFRESPVGRLPALIDQVIGGCPPVAASVCEYAWLRYASARLVVVIVSGLRTAVIDSGCVSVAGTYWESVTCTVKFQVPVVVTVPLMTPVEEASVNPGGRLPEMTAHVYGVQPPVAASVCEYATFTIASGSVVVVISRAASVPMTIDSGCVAVPAGESESATSTVKLAVSAVVGTPLMTPVEGASVSPAGRFPDITDHVYGLMPPAAWSVWE